MDQQDWDEEAWTVEPEALSQQERDNLVQRQRTCLSKLVNSAFQSSSPATCAGKIKSDNVQLHILQFLTFVCSRFPGVFLGGDVKYSAPLFMRLFQILAEPVMLDLRDQLLCTFSALYSLMLLKERRVACELLMDITKILEDLRGACQDYDLALDCSLSLQEPRVEIATLSRFTSLYHEAEVQASSDKMNTREGNPFDFSPTPSAIRLCCQRKLHHCQGSCSQLALHLLKLTPAHLVPALTRLYNVVIWQVGDGPMELKQDSIMLIHSVHSRLQPVWPAAGVVLSYIGQIFSQAQGTRFSNRSSAFADFACAALKFAADLATGDSSDISDFVYEILVQNFVALSERASSFAPLKESMAETLLVLLRRLCKSGPQRLPQVQELVALAKTWLADKGVQKLVVAAMAAAIAYQTQDALTHDVEPQRRGRRDGATKFGASDGVFVPMKFPRHRVLAKSPAPDKEETCGQDREAERTELLHKVSAAGAPYVQRSISWKLSDELIEVSGRPAQPLSAAAVSLDTALQIFRRVHYRSSLQALLGRLKACLLQLEGADGCADPLQFNAAVGLVQTALEAFEVGDLADVRDAMSRILLMPWRTAHDPSHASRHCDAKVAVACLAVLSFSASGDAAQEVPRIFAASMQDESAEVRGAAVAYAPLAMYSCGGIPDAVDQILPAMARLVISEDSPDVLQCLGGAVGQVACVLTGRLPPASTVAKFTTVQEVLRCDLCSGASRCTNLRFTKHLQQLSPFFELLNMSDKAPDACRAFVKSTAMVVVHGWVDGPGGVIQDAVKRLLELISDSSRGVRLAVADCLPLLIQTAASFSLDENAQPLDNDTALNNMRQSASFVLKKIAPLLHANAHIADTVVVGLCNLASMPDLSTDLVVDVVVHLTQLLASPDLTLRDLAITGIESIGRARGDGPKEFIARIGPQLFPRLAMLLLSHEAALHELAHAIFRQDLKHFMSHNLKHILPFIAKQRKERLLEQVAAVVQSTPEALLFDHLHPVLVHLFAHPNPNEQEQTAKFLHRVTRISLSELIKSGLPDLLTALILDLGSNPAAHDARDRITRAEATLSVVVDMRSVGGDAAQALPAVRSDRGQTLGDVLAQHFLHIMFRINQSLLDKNVECEEKLCALRSLGELIVRMGPKVTTFLPKILSSLLLGVRAPPLRKCALEVWRRLVEVGEASVVAAHLGQIVVNLLPYLDDHTTLVVGILEQLIVHKCAHTSKYFKDIPFMSPSAALQNVARALQQERGDVSLVDHLQELCACVGNSDSSEVRVEALRQLVSTMARHQPQVLAMAQSDSDSLDSVLNQLVRTLLSVCADSKYELRQLGCECLGLLGAVDPCRVQLPCTRVCPPNLEDDDLMLHLLNVHLVKLLRAADSTKSQDKAAYAAQELLRLLGCTASTPEAAFAICEGTADDSGAEDKATQRACDAWNSLHEDVRLTLQPCLSSKYNIPTRAQAAPVASAIYSPGMSFAAWIADWTYHLIWCTSGPRHNIFLACRGVVRDDVATAMFLLPFLVHNVVCFGTDEQRLHIQLEVRNVLEQKAAAAQQDECVQAVFLLVDFLNRWLELMRQAALASASAKKASLSDAIRKEHVERVSTFVKCIPKDELASAAYRCSAHARAYLYYEMYLREKKKTIEQKKTMQQSSLYTQAYEFEDADVEFLQKIYSGLDDPDGIPGFASMRRNTSLAAHILDHENAGHWTEALDCYEQALQQEPTSTDYHRGVLKCLRNLGHYQIMVAHSEGALAHDQTLAPQIAPYAIQAAWRLSAWDTLHKFLASNPAPRFEVNLALVLEAFRAGNEASFAERLLQAREHVIPGLSAASMESYQRAYPFIVKLHMLHELQHAFSIKLSNPNTEDTAIWDARLRITQASLKTREPLLSLRRVLFSELQEHDRVAHCWLHIAKLARVSGSIHTAASAVLHASTRMPRLSHIERAKQLWQQGDAHKALLQLRDELRTGKPDHQLSPDEARVVAKTVLLYARWAQQTGQEQTDDIVKHYSRVIRLQPKWEKGYFFLGRFYDALLDAQQTSNQRSGSLSSESAKAAEMYLPLVLENYSKALSNGHLHIYQCLPRLLTLWFDYSTSLSPAPPAPPAKHDYSRVGTSSASGLNTSRSKGSNAPQPSAIVRAHVMVKDMSLSMPSYVWLSVLAQLVSRICHRNGDVWAILRRILVTVVHTYPHQAVWFIVPVSESSEPERAQRAAIVLQEASGKASKEGKDILNHAVQLCKRLIELTKCAIPQNKMKVSIKNEFRALHRMFPMPVIVPIQSNLTLTLPPGGLHDLAHMPFPGPQTTMHAIMDELDVISSLQRPKKITIRGGDGRDYVFLCKTEPKGDMRKDARMIEFNSLLNRLFTKDTEGRARKLRMRTYAVIPLNEECGFIEWVNNTSGLRPILSRLYKFDGHDKTTMQIKEAFDAAPGREVETYRQMLTWFPPVLHKWFLNTFPDPTSWLQSRLAYTRSTAVWSMVGHIVGLGDRHGENILVESTSGETVHVDLSCLFDKGVTMATPERVPFRLTPNMVDALGLAGYEGTFRRSCEVTMRILRDNRETLMNVLHTFIHDPLVEWSPKLAPGTDESEPTKVMARVEQRLQGISDSRLPLSVQGQVHQLINQAVDISNLGRMYIWWMPWY